MNLNIPLNIITNNIKSTIDKFEHEKNYIDYLEKYSILDKYTYIKPNKLKNNINVGDIIRYSKSIDHGISCASLIIQISYTNKKEMYIDHLVLTSLHHRKSIWKLPIHMNPYFVFRYENTGKSKIKSKNKKRTIEAIKVFEKLKEKKDVDFKKLIEADPNIKDKIKWKDPINKECMDEIDKLIDDYNHKFPKGKSLLIEDNTNYDPDLDFSYDY
jgi:hypothetical protein